MNREGYVEKYEGGEVHHLSDEQKEKEAADASEFNLVGHVEGSKVSYLTTPEMMKDRLDEIEVELADMQISHNQLLAEKERLTNELANLDAQKN